MERDKTLKHNIEPDEDQPMAGPHYQHRHGGWLLNLNHVAPRQGP